MEDMLQKLSIQFPPPGLREKVLAAARAELEQAAKKPDWVDRVWESRAFWYSAAATVLLCLIAIFAAPTNGQTRQLAMIPPAQPPPATVALAKELAASLGDGPALERQLTAMLTGPAAGGQEAFNRAELWRSIQ